MIAGYVCGLSVAPHLQAPVSLRPRRLRGRAVPMGDRDLDASAAVASVLELDEHLLGPIVQCYLAAYRQTGDPRELTWAHELCREWTKADGRSEAQLDAMEQLVQAMMKSCSVENLRKACRNQRGPRVLRDV